jgi:hypothetical protein
MATPNLLSLTTVTFDRDVWAATNTLTTRVTAAASETVVVFSIKATNIHASAVGWITYTLNNGTDFKGAFQIAIPLNAMVECLDKPLTMNPSDLLKLQANASTNVETIVSMLRFT